MIEGLSHCFSSTGVNSKGQNKDRIKQGFLILIPNDRKFVLGENILLFFQGNV